MIKGFQVLGAFLLAVAFSAGASAQTAAKVGFVDMQRAIQTTAAGKKAKEQLEKDFKKKKEELEKKEADLRKMNEELSKRSSVMTDEARTQRQQSLQEEMVKYRELVGKSQVDIQKKERELTAPIVKKLQELIEEMAKKEGYSMILSLGQNDVQVVLWATKESDLTDRLIEQFNKKK